jgi:hypothetical protein
MNLLDHRNTFGTLLASLIHTPFSHDAFLVVDLSNSSYRSLGHVIRTGSTPLAAPKLHPGAGSNYRDHILAQMTSGRDEGVAAGPNRSRPRRRPRPRKAVFSLICGFRP